MRRNVIPRSAPSVGRLKLADLIVERRKCAGLTQAQVALALGHPQSMVAEIEAGRRRMDVLELLEIASAIGFPPSELIVDLSIRLAAADKE